MIIWGCFYIKFLRFSFIVWIRIRIGLAWIRIRIKVRSGSGFVMNFSRSWIRIRKEFFPVLYPDPNQYDTYPPHCWWSLKFVFERWILHILPQFAYVAVLLVADEWNLFRLLLQTGGLQTSPGGLGRSCGSAQKFQVPHFSFELIKNNEALS